MSDFVQPLPNLTAWPGASEADNMWRKLNSLYGEVFQRSWQEWLTTSTEIVQQQAVRAILDTSQALFESATQLQQKAWGQLWSANQQATAIVADGLTRSATEAVNKVTAHVAAQATEAVSQAAAHAAKATQDASHALNQAAEAGKK